MEHDNPFSEKYDFVGWDPGSDGGDSSTSSAVPDQESSLTIEDLHEAIRKVQEIIPKPPMDAILLSKRLPRHRSFVRDYQGKTYMIFNKVDFENEIRALEARGLLQYKDDVGKFIVEGTLGSIAGVPILEDENLVIDIFIEEFRAMMLVERLRDMYENGIIILPPGVE